MKNDGASSGLHSSRKHTFVSCGVPTEHFFELLNKVWSQNLKQERKLFSVKLRETKNGGAGNFFLVGSVTLVVSCDAPFLTVLWCSVFLSTTKSGENVSTKCVPSERRLRSEHDVMMKITTVLACILAHFD